MKYIISFIIILISYNKAPDELKEKSEKIILPISKGIEIIAQLNLLAGLIGALVIGIAINDSLMFYFSVFYLMGSFITVVKTKRMFELMDSNCFFRDQDRKARAFRARFEEDFKKRNSRHSHGSKIQGTTMSRQNAFNILGIPYDSDTFQIKKRYRTLAKKYHPDILGDESKMKELNNAMDIIH